LTDCANENDNDTRRTGGTTMSTSQPTQPGTGTETPIEVPYPDAGDLHLRITEGACRLKIAPGASDVWISGTQRDPSGLRPLSITQEGGTVRLSEQASTSTAWEWLRSGRGVADVPTFDLALGTAKPFRLTVEIGASANRFDLGGVPISRLAVRHGAGKTEIDFSAPNPQAMTLMEIGAGAGSTELRNLANAHFAELVVEGGMAAYVIDFGGVLQQDAHARINAALSSVEIVVPATTAAKIATESPLGHVELGDGFTAKEGAFWTPAAMEGRKPLLTISATMTLGSLTLRAS
jgi:hypothetical protein